MWSRIGYVVLLNLLNGILAQRLTPLSQFTNVDDVTQDHAILRANCTIVLSVFRGTTFPACHNADGRHDACFFGAICGRADCDAILSSAEDWKMRPIACR